MIVLSLRLSTALLGGLLLRRARR